MHGGLDGSFLSAVHFPPTSWNPGVLVLPSSDGPADKPEIVLQSILHSLESALVLTPANFGAQSAFAAVPSTMH